MFRGKPNLQGRKTGSINKVNSQVKGMIAEFVESEASTFRERLENLSDADYCKTYLKLMHFVIPTMRSIDAPVVEKEFPFDKIEIEIIGNNSK
ncbi:hypothetical protein [Polaribacter sp. HL-MS24]|uniref:hypothetical protein n=1 Tax=Polaribacter sp. HL-MS24 TaxID=3077735 RepID=UPI002934D3CA|nr:hypothetical protein [Polaribacter sp. HL-MS24]WOC41052.1 hypothetical protein RRF69_04650 [Polaribacter sp. HL-MS24]